MANVSENQLKFRLDNVHITTSFSDDKNIFDIYIENNTDKDLVFNDDFMIKCTFPFGEGETDLCTLENAKSILAIVKSDDWDIIIPKFPPIETSSAYWQISPKYDETVLKVTEPLLVKFYNVATNTKEGDTKITCAYHDISLQNNISEDIRFHKYLPATIEATLPKDDDFNEVDQIVIWWEMTNAQENSATMNGTSLKTLAGNVKVNYQEVLGNVKFSVKNEVGRLLEKAFMIVPCKAHIDYFRITYYREPKETPRCVLEWKTNTLNTQINGADVNFSGSWHSSSSYQGEIVATDIKGNVVKQNVTKNATQNWHLYERFCISMCTPEEEQILWSSDHSSQKPSD